MGNTYHNLRKLQSAHGGDDPGKIGINNALEKEINLEIAQKLYTTLIDNQIPAVIHQNSYPSSEISGAQVFYYTQSQKGKVLAECIQAELIRQLAPANHRQAKANDSYYLLKKTSSPTVIVECGFLSNPIEADLLCDPDYQDLIVSAIYSGVRAYLDTEYPQTSTEELLFSTEN